MSFKVHARTHATLAEGGAPSKKKARVESKLSKIPLFASFGHSNFREPRLFTRHISALVPSECLNYFSSMQLSEKLLEPFRNNYRTHLKDLTSDTRSTRQKKLATELEQVIKNDCALALRELTPFLPEIESKSLFAALKIAVKNENANTVRSILPSLSDKNREELGEQLRLASEKGSSEIVKALLEFVNLIPNSDLSYGCVCAAEKGYYETVKAFLPFAKKFPSWGLYKSLEVAARWEHVHVLKLILENSDNIEDFRQAFSNALAAAAHKVSTLSVRILFEYISKVKPKDLGEGLYIAAGKHDALPILQIFFQHIDLISRDDFGRALVEAIKHPMGLEYVNEFLQFKHKISIEWKNNAFYAVAEEEEIFNIISVTDFTFGKDSLKRLSQINSLLRSALNG
jgi:hydroxypyruvate isomerase